MLFSCIGPTWSVVVCQYVKCCKYCTKWPQDLHQMPVTETRFLCASIWNINGLLWTVLFMLSFLIHSLLHFKSSSLILNPLHLYYSYSMNNSILIQHLEKVCLCMHTFWKAISFVSPCTLQVPSKKEKLKKSWKRQYSLSTFQTEKFFNISDTFN